MSGLLPLAARADTVSVEGLYDFRHTTDREDNRDNFPVLELKVFVPQSFGAFLLKSEIDLDGTKHNASQAYSELAQSIKLGGAQLWGLPLLARLSYSVGLGLFNNASSGFYIPNAYTVGLETAFRVAQANWDISVSLRDTSLPRASYDPMLTFYVERYGFNNKLLIAHSLEAWTTSRLSEADGLSQPRSGRTVSWELESEAWYKLTQDLSAGVYIRTTRNVYVMSNRWIVYPSLGVRYSF
jgi:hypothetical protein